MSVTVSGTILTTTTTTDAVSGISYIMPGTGGTLWTPIPSTVVVTPGYTPISVNEHQLLTSLSNVYQELKKDPTNNELMNMLINLLEQLKLNGY